MRLRTVASSRACLAALAALGVLGVLGALTVLVVCGSAPASARSAREIVLYVEPVAAGVVDPFRPPAHVGAPGNRGLEYGNAPDALVRASAHGWVTFAGQVAGTQAITIRHTDGVRTTYTGLDTVFVSEHEQVAQGSSLGVANGHLHFGARVGHHYLDPQVLLDASVPVARPRLVPPPAGAS